MTDRKAAPLQSPFERFADFTRRIVAVPKSEVDKKKRELERRRKRKVRTPRSSQ